MGFGTFYGVLSQHSGLGQKYKDKASQIKNNCIAPISKYSKEEEKQFKKLKSELTTLDKDMNKMTSDIDKLKEKYHKNADIAELSEKKKKHASLAMEDKSNLDFGMKQYKEMESAAKNDKMAAAKSEKEYKDQVNKANEYKKKYVTEKKRILNVSTKIKKEKW